MRTTLTLDDDVTVLIEKVRRREKAGLKAVVNEALRRGLRHMLTPQKTRGPYRTPAVSLGKCFYGSLDDVAEVLAVAEREDLA